MVAKAPRPPRSRGVLPHVETGVERATLDQIFDHLTVYPEGFTVHPKLARQFESRAKLYHNEGLVDWATGEALAIGSLVLEGHPVRFTGEDTRRGTFGQRHAALIDYENETNWIPLGDLPGSTARFWVYDSLLSEYAALGYEYGYANSNPEALVAWEAQFGDFVNGAQVVIDQYIVAAEDKWNQPNGLVMLLPHGFEGQGPEHSSARHRALPPVLRRGQHPGGQRDHRGAVLPPAAPPGPARHPQAARRVHAEAAAAHAAEPLGDRRARARFVPGGPRRPRRTRRRDRAADRVLLRQGGVGCRSPSATSARHRSP